MRMVFPQIVFVSTAIGAISLLLANCDSENKRDLDLTGELGASGNTGGNTGISGAETGNTDNTDENNQDNGFDENDAGTDPATCDEQDFNIKFVPTRLMILQDLSGSMKSGNWNPDAIGALTAMLENPSNAAIEFGFDKFPNPSPGNNDCAADAPVVQDTEPNMQGTILSIIKDKNIWPDDIRTPLCLSMMNFDPAVHPGYAEKFQNGEGESYLLVVSDGDDSCGCGTIGQSQPSHLADQTKALLDAGIRTMIIGFKVKFSDQLNAIAAAGGTEFDTYFDVNDQAGLEAALDSIASSVATCIFDIKEPSASADPDQVNFLLDGQKIGRDDTCTSTGWRWRDDTHAQVEFCGDACEKIKAGEFTKAGATFGCPTLVI